LYDESVLVPWVLRFPPKVPAGTVVTEQAKLADVAPTLLSLLDIEPRRLFGRWPLEEGRARDLSPLLGAAASPSTLLEDEAPAFGDLRGELTSVRTEHWKLIRDERTGSVELYDLFADPGEGTDVAAAQPEVTLRLSRRLAAWRHTTDVAAGRRQALRQSDEHLEQLRVLGYVE
jgi:arylsulfatase A-like enzyme